MLSCKQVAMRADALLDGELGMMNRLQMRIHLLMCKGCSAFVAQMRATRRLSDAAITQGGEEQENRRQIAEILRRVRGDTAADPMRDTPENEGKSDEKPEN
jgi:anti-sigma factor RsiW